MRATRAGHGPERHGVRSPIRLQVEPPGHRRTPWTSAEQRKGGASPSHASATRVRGARRRRGGCTADRATTGRSSARRAWPRASASDRRSCCGHIAVPARQDRARDSRGRPSTSSARAARALGLRPRSGSIPRGRPSATPRSSRCSGGSRRFSARHSDATRGRAPARGRPSGVGRDGRGRRRVPLSVRPSRIFGTCRRSSAAVDAQAPGRPARTRGPPRRRAQRRTTGESSLSIGRPFGPSFRSMAASIARAARRWPPASAERDHPRLG